MTDDEVTAQLRLHGVEDVALVERAYIEPNGMISVVGPPSGETGSGEAPPDR